ncbi:hypothetical protein [Georgenia faecalis]|uniref:hypothetical protein n=1 Tax=Georgenia faecalis TaxID=2483799 RepID=UPI000FD70001|nr:hypothetical protein [Georgenia faecalis]
MTEIAANAPSPDDGGLDVQLVALARGHLAAALGELPPASDAALEACAAWSELEEPGHLPQIRDVRPPQQPSTSLRLARDLLRDATGAALDGERAMAFARAVRHLDDALGAVAGGPKGGA